MNKKEAEELFSSMSPEDQDKFISGLSADENAQFQAILSEPEVPESMVSKILTPVGKVLDYAGGLSRTAVANRPEVKMTEMLSNYFQGKEFQKDALKREVDEMLGALKGSPKSGADLMKDRGVPEMGSVELPVLGKVTGRGALGLVAEGVTDPLNAVAIGPAVKSMGKSMYRAGLSNIDRIMPKKGKEIGEFAETAYKFGIKGNFGEMADQVDTVADQLLKRQQEILKQATDAGALVDGQRVFNKVIKEASGTATNKKVIDRTVKSQAKNFAEDLTEFAEANKYIPEKLPDAEQVPMFFGDELPTGGTKIEVGTDLAVDATPIKTTQKVAPQQEAFDALQMKPQREKIGEVKELFNATPAWPEFVSPEFTKWLDRKGITPEQYKNLASQLDEAGEKAGWAFEANSPEAIGQFEVLSKTLGYEPDILSSVFKQRQKNALQKLSGEYGTVDQALQYDLLSAGSGKKLGTAVKEVPWESSQGASAITKGQQSLVRPGDVMPAQAKITPAQGLTPLDTSDVKTQLYNMLSSDAYSTLRNSKQGERLIKKAARRAKTATELAVKKVDPLLAKELRQVNKDLGTLLSGKQALANQRTIEMGKNAVTPVDTAMAYLNPAAAVAKKVGDISKGPRFRTGIGMSMQQGALEGALPIGINLGTRNLYDLIKGDDSGNR